MIRFDKPDPNKARANRKKHGVTFAEAESVFYDESALTQPDYDSDPNEERWVTLGTSELGRVLVVAFTYRCEDQIRIISARKTTKNEQKEYSDQ